MFKGTYRHRIDGKGRLPVPAAFRKALLASRSERGSTQGAGPAEPELVLTPLDQCLAAYPTAEWRRLERALRALPPFSRPAKALARLLASRAVDAALDVQGRILLPRELREHAGLQREALIVGVVDRFELWLPERWAGFVRESEHLLNDASLDVAWPIEAGASAGLSAPPSEPSSPSVTKGAARAPGPPRRPQAKPKP